MNSGNESVCGSAVSPESQMQAPVTAYGNVQLEEDTTAATAQTQSTLSTTDSLPKKKGNRKRSRRQPNKLTSVVDSQASHQQLATSEPPASHVFPGASLAPGAPPLVPKPSNGHGNREVTAGVGQAGHTIQWQIPGERISSHAVHTTGSSLRNQQTSSQLFSKSRHVSRRKKTLSAAATASSTAMEKLTEPSQVPHLYCPTRHVSYPTPGSCNLQHLQGYSMDSEFPHIPIDNSWMMRRNAAVSPSNITDRNVSMEKANTPHFNLLSLYNLQKPLPSSSHGKKFEESTKEDNKEHQKLSKLNNDTKKTNLISSEIYSFISKTHFPDMNNDHGSPAELSSAHLSNFYPPVESVFGNLLTPSPCNSVKEDEHRNETSRCDSSGAFSKMKMMFDDKNDNISRESDPSFSLPLTVNASMPTPHSCIPSVMNASMPSPHSGIRSIMNASMPSRHSGIPSIMNASVPSHHPGLPPIVSACMPISHHIMKPLHESPGSPSPMSIPTTPMNTPPRLRMPSSLDTSSTQGNQVYPFLLPNANISTARPAVIQKKAVFCCHLCTFSSKSKSEFESHMKIHFPFTCPHCDYTSRTEGRLYCHIRDFHSENNFRHNLSHRTKIFKCKKCSFSVMEKEKLWEHCRTHIKEDKILQCPHCSYVTEYKTNLENHIRNHFGSKPFKCEKCNYSSVAKSTLHSHMKSHTKMFPYRCLNCKFASKYCNKLKLHIKKCKHRSAVVLNQDGSRPKKFDAEMSGLSFSSNSAHPENQVHLGSNKNSAFGTPICEMPTLPLGMPIMTPAFNNMIPFWPMLHHTGMPCDTSIQLGMLGSPVFPNQLMGIITANKDGNQFKGESGLTKEKENGRVNKKTNNSLTCKVCNLKFKSTEAMSQHISQKHKSTTNISVQDSSNNGKVLADKVDRNSNEKECNKHQLPHSPSVSDFQEGQLNDNFGSRSLPKSHIDYQTEEKIESTHVLQAKPLLSDPIKCDIGNAFEGMHGRIIISSSKNEIIRDNTNRADIVNQTTLDYRPAADSDKILPGEQVFQNKEKGNQNTTTDFNSGCGNQFNTRPLDLTQQKLTVFNNAGLPVVKKHGNEVITDGEISSYEVKTPSTASEELLHIISKHENAAFNSNTLTDETITRKRSRKGRPFKLDAICLKGEKMQPDVARDHTEHNTACGYIKPVQYSETDLLQAHGKNIFEAEKNQQNIVSDQNYVTIESHPEFYKDKLKCLEVKSTEIMAHESNKKHDKRSNTLKTAEIELEKDPKIGDIGSPGKIGNGTLHLSEAELELYKLKRSLTKANEQLESVSNLSKTCQQEKQFAHNSESTSANVTSSEQAKEHVFSVNDAISENKDSVVNSEHNPSSMGQTELMNAPTEEQEKSVNSPTKSGTYLEQRMMKEKVNPLPSVPLAISSPFQVQTFMSSTVLHSSSPSKAVTISNHTLVNNNIKSLNMLPLFSHPHYSYSSQISNWQVQNSILPMKPPGPVCALASMAKINPTNWMIPDPTAMLTLPVKEENKKAYECTHCELLFEDDIMYTVHMGYHNKQNPFKCNSCGTVSKDKVEFFLHMARSAHM